MKAESENSGLSEAAPEPGPRGAWRSRAPHSASGFQYSGLTLYIVIDVFSRSCLAESLAPTTVPAPPPPRRGVPSPVPALAFPSSVDRDPTATPVDASFSSYKTRDTAGR